MARMKPTITASIGGCISNGNELQLGDAALHCDIRQKVRTWFPFPCFIAFRSMCTYDTSLSLSRLALTRIPEQFGATEYSESVNFVQ